MAAKTPYITVRQPWADLIVNGVQLFEIRSEIIRYRGPLLIFATTLDIYETHRLQLPEGDTNVVIGYAHLFTINAITRKEWMELQRQDKVRGGRPYGDQTFMWIFERPKRFAAPAPFDDELMISVFLIPT